MGHDPHTLPWARTGSCQTRVPTAHRGSSGDPPRLTVRGNPAWEVPFPSAAVGMSNRDVLRPSEGTKLGLLLPKLAVKPEGHHVLGFMEGASVAHQHPRAPSNSEETRWVLQISQAVQRRDKFSFLD